MKGRILIADNDRELCQLLGGYLAREGFSVEMVHSANATIEYMGRLDRAPDLLILDVMMEDKDGLAVLKELRTRSDVPILMLSALGEPRDRVVGLELGADDYLGKPCLPQELLARIKALLRRGTISAVDPLEVGPLKHEPERRCFSVDGQALSLTQAEYGLLLCLAQHAGFSVDKPTLTRSGLCRDYGPLEQSVDTYVSRLRRKLAQASAAAPTIEPVRGVGYVLVERAT